MCGVNCGDEHYVERNCTSAGMLTVLVELVFRIHFLKCFSNSVSFFSLCGVFLLYDTYSFDINVVIRNNLWLLGSSEVLCPSPL